MSKLLMILLVEDNPADIRLTKEMLRKAGIYHELHIAEDGESAISYLNSQLKPGTSRLPDLILLDLNLPRMQGAEVLQVIRRTPSLKDLPVAVLTTSENPDDKRAVEELGVSCFLSKENLHYIISALGQAFSVIQTAAAKSKTDTDDKINVLVIEDNPADARFLVKLMEKQKAVELKATCCRTLKDGLSHLIDAPDAILLNLGLPDSQGLGALRTLRRLAHNCPVVILTGLDDQALGIEALKLGAQDFLVKGTITPELILRSIRYAIERKRAELLSQEAEVLKDCKVPGRGDFALSQREREVLSLVAEGLSNQEVAERLIVSSETIKTHMRHIMEKLLVSDRTHAAVKAIREGLL